MVGPYFGQGFPGFLSLPTELRIRTDIGPDGELVDISDLVDRKGIVGERNLDSGASTWTIPFLSEVGNQYDIWDTNNIFIDSDDAIVLGAANLYPDGWPQTGAWHRYFMGVTVRPDSTMLSPDERQFTLQCVDNSWWEKYPPMNPGLPYPPGGTPYASTVATSGITHGSNVTIIPFRMKNLYAGADIFVTAPISGTYIERTTIESVNYTGQLVITQQILAAGVHTVNVSDTTGITVGQPYHVYNVSDGTHWETIYPTAVNPGVSFTASFVNSHKTGDWVLMAGSFVADFDYDFPSYATTAAASIADFKSLQTITPLDMSFIEPGMQLTLSNADHSYPEVVTVTDTTATTFDAVVAWPKSSNFNIEAYPSIISGPSDQKLLAGEWYQDVDNLLTPIAGMLYTFYDDSESYQDFTPYSAGTDVVISVGTALMRNIFPGRYILLQNADGTNRERVLVKATDTASFTVDLATDKAAGFYIFNGPYVDKTRVDEVVPLVALTSVVTSKSGSITYEGKSISQMWSEIESQALDIDTRVENGVSAGSDVVIRPYNMYGIRPNKPLFIENNDGTNSETVIVKTVTRTTFTADLTSSKSADFRIFGRVKPAHYWSQTPDTPGSPDPAWTPQPRYYDKEIQGKLALRVLSDGSVVDPVSGIPYGEYTVRRDGTDHYNAVQVLGKNNSWARFVDWDSVLGLHGKKATYRILEGPPVSRSDIYTNDECYETAAAIVAQHNFCKETPTVTVYGMIDPDIFYEVESVTFYKSGETSFDPAFGGKTLPVNHIRVSFEDGMAKYEIELGDIVPEGISHAIAGLNPQVAGHARKLGPPVHQTTVVTKSQNLTRSATAYMVDATNATTNNQRTVTLPEIGTDPTWYATIHKVDDSDNPVIVKAPDNSLINGQGQLAIKRGGGPLHVFSDGTGYRAIMGFDNPHNIDDTHGDRLEFSNKDGAVGGFIKTQDFGAGSEYLTMQYDGSTAPPSNQNYNGLQFQGPGGGMLAIYPNGMGFFHTMMFSNRFNPTGNFTISTKDQTYYWPVNTYGGSSEVTLPDYTSSTDDFAQSGMTFVIGKADTSANTVTIKVPSGQYLSGVQDGTYVISTPHSYVIAALLLSETVSGTISFCWEILPFGGGVELDTKKSLEWNLRGIDSRKLGWKDVTYTLPFNAQISGAAFFHNYLTSGGVLSGVPVSGLYNFWRGTRNRSAWQIDWDSSPLNPDPIGLPGQAMNEELADGTWTQDLSKDDVIAVEVVYADASTRTVLISLDMVIQP